MLAVQALGCGPAEHEGHVKGLVAAKKDNIKTQKSLMEELAGLHGQTLANEAQKQGHARLCWNLPPLLCYAGAVLCGCCSVLWCCAVLCCAVLSRVLLYTVSRDITFLNPPVLKTVLEVHPDGTLT